MNNYKIFVDKPIEYKKVDSSFIELFDDNYRNLIISDYESFKTATYFDDEVVRLEGIVRLNGNLIIYISKMKFFDFVIQNIIPVDYFKFLKYINEKELSEEKREYMETIRWLANKYTNVKGIKCILENRYFPNCLAVSILIKDIDNSYLLTRRSSRVGISNGYLSVSVTGALDSCDYDSDNPIIHCAIRETYEEINLKLDPSNIKVESIIFGRRKCQPIVLVNANVEIMFRNTIDKIMQARDFNKENTEIILCSKKDIFIYLENGYECTEAAKEHFYLAYSGDI
jgi:hypothetical protein